MKPYGQNHQRAAVLELQGTEQLAGRLDGTLWTNLPVGCSAGVAKHRTACRTTGRDLTDKKGLATITHMYAVKDIRLLSRECLLTYKWLQTIFAGLARNISIRSLGNKITKSTVIYIC